MIPPNSPEAHSTEDRAEEVLETTHWAKRYSRSYRLNVIRRGRRAVGSQTQLCRAWYPQPWDVRRRTYPSVKDNFAIESYTKLDLSHVQLVFVDSIDVAHTLANDRQKKVGLLIHGNPEGLGKTFEWGYNSRRYCLQAEHNILCDISISFSLWNGVG